MSFNKSAYARRNRFTQLNVQELGSRIVPAVLINQIDLDGDGATDDISIVGDVANNKITVNDNGVDQLHITIDANGDGDTIDKNDKDFVVTFSNDSVVLEVSLGAGNDSFSYTTNAVLDGSARTLTVDLGAGNDAIVWNSNFQITNKSRISLDVNGAAGNDTGNILLGQVNSSVLSIRSDWGAGNDNYQLKMDQVDSVAAAEIVTNLGAGLNTHVADFDGVGKFNQGAMDVSIVGGAQKDNIKVIVHDDVGNGSNSSHFSVGVDLLAGDDLFQLALDGNDFRVDDHSQASIVVRGGAGNDQLSVQANTPGTIRIDTDGLLNLNLQGEAGNDTISVSISGASSLDMVGVFRVRVDGGLGNDVLNTMLTNTATTTGAYDIAVRGGVGNDTMLFSLNNNGGTPTFGPANGIILDGGLGVDSLSNGNVATSFMTSIENLL